MTIMFLDSENKDDETLSSSMEMKFIKRCIQVTGKYDWRLVSDFIPR